MRMKGWGESKEGKETKTQKKDLNTSQKLKGIIDVNEKCNTIKFLEDNIGKI